MYAPPNDATVKIDAVSGTGRINTISVTGTAPDATESYNNPTYTSNTVGGASAEFNVTRLDTAYSATAPVGGTGYQVGEEFVIDGAQLGGVSSTNDCTILVATVDGGTGEILTITVTGINDAPTSTTPPTIRAVENGKIRVRPDPFFDDPDPATNSFGQLTYSFCGLPAGLKYNENGAITKNDKVVI